MKKWLAGLIIAAVIVILAVPIASTRAADTNQLAEPNAPAKKATITFKGVVHVAKDTTGNITVVKIKRDDNSRTYDVTLDAKGKELGEKESGKTAEVTGTLATEGKVKWLTVEKYKRVSKEYLLGS